MGAQFRRRFATQSSYWTEREPTPRKKNEGRRTAGYGPRTEDVDIKRNEHGEIVGTTKRFEY
jgi:hypothetical protein